MVVGKKVKIPFNRYAMPRFEVSMRHENIPYRTCGSGVLSMVTGANPQVIEKRLPKGQEHWTTHAVKRYLRHRRWHVTTLTIRAVTNVEWTRFPLNDDHLLLLALQMDLEDQSWLVAHKGLIYHNFEVEKFTGMYLLNKPVAEAYLLHRA
jgi:hypothetical protein